MTTDKIIHIFIACKKKTIQTPADRALAKKSMQTFAIGQNMFRDTIESIVDRMSKEVETKERNMAHDKVALQILENEKWSQLAKILVDSDDLWIKSVIDNFNQAHKDLKKCWKDKDRVKFDIRLFALRMTYICEVYKKLFTDKNLKNLKTERYFAHILPALVNCMLNRNKKKHSERKLEIKSFAIDIFRFTKVKSTTKFVQQAINKLLVGETDKRLEWIRATKNNIIEWIYQWKRDEPLLKITSDLLNDLVSTSITFKSSSDVPELTKKIENLTVVFPPTNFVISTIAYVPEYEFASDSSDEEKDGTFSDADFDLAKTGSFPFTTTCLKYVRKKEINFEKVLNLYQSDSISTVMTPFLKKLSLNGFEEHQKDKLTSISASIALNRMKSLSTRKNESLDLELDSKIETDIRYEKFGFYWPCEWYDKKKTVPYTTVRKFYKQLKRIDRKRAQQFLEISEKNITVPYQKLRDYAKKHDKTKKLVQQCRKKFPNANIYLSLIDSDTVDFNGIYSGYLRIVADSSEIPTVMSTGYEFPIDYDYGYVYQLASHIDRMVRVITARYLPLGVYYPEPNMCILIPPEHCTLPESFINKKKGENNLESACLLIQLQNRKKATFIFSKDKPLITAIPDRAKKNKKPTKAGPRNLISFSLLCKQGDLPTKDDLKSFKQVAQSHFHEYIWYNNVFVNNAIKFTKDYVQNPEHLRYCQDCLAKARNSKKANEQEKENSIAEPKQYMPNNIMKIMVKKSVLRHCIHLLAKIRKEDTDKEDAIVELKQYIAPDIVNAIVNAAASLKQYISHFKIDYIRSEEETTLFKILKEYKIEIKCLTRDKILMLAQQEILELFKKKIINPQRLIGLDTEILEYICYDEEIIEILKNKTVDFDSLLNLLKDNLSNFMEARAEYPISYILNSYEENPLHLTFMAGDPTDIVYKNLENEALVRFGLKNYLNDSDTHWIRAELNKDRENQDSDFATLMDFDRIIAECEEEFSHSDNDTDYEERPELKDVA